MNYVSILVSSWYLVMDLMRCCVTRVGIKCQDSYHHQIQSSLVASPYIPTSLLDHAFIYLHKLLAFSFMCGRNSGAKKDHLELFKNDLFSPICVVTLYFIIEIQLTVFHPSETRQKGEFRNGLLGQS